MAIVTMKRLSLLALKADKENIYNALIRTASVELKRCEDLPNCVVCDNSADREVVAERVKRAEEAVSYVSEQVDRFNATHAKSQAVTPDKNSFARPKTEVNFDDFIGFDKKAAAVEREISDLFALRDKLAELNGQLTQLNNEYANTLTYTKLPHPTTWYRDTECALVRLCLVPTSEIADLTELAEKFDTVCLEKIDASASTALVAVVCHKADADFLQQAAALGLVQSGFVCDVLPSAKLQTLDSRIADVKKQIEQTTADVCNYSHKLGQWKVYIDYTELVGKKLAADGDLQQTSSAFVLEAYYPADSEDKVLSAVAAVTDCVETYTYDIGETEFAPTLCRNNGVVKQFEFVTNNYTPPDYHEIDPNPVMSFFYFIIFGLMVADIGYGLLLVAAGLFAHFAIKQKTTIRTMLQLFGICGVAAIIVGAMFGSFFSFPLQNIFPWWNPLIPDPSQYPMVMMAISLMFGVVHITAGVACRMAVKIKHKQALSAWFVDFPWVIVFVAFILAILNPALDMVGYEPYLALKLPDAASKISLYVCLGALAVAIIFAGLDSKGILGKAMASFNAAYGLINYFSDIMSYIRVFGLMLSSALMGQVINQLAGMVLGGGGVGYVFAVLLLIFAHMFNLVMGILGVYIHDGRLQYVEFFGKFYTGDGQLFVPFGCDTRYTLLK
ncbi:MAG TPA: hypothetical protein DHU79_06535 [Clostridiales bacterium]|nr:hypothetical protein [Clostridiales bacterium]